MRKIILFILIYLCVTIRAMSQLRGKRVEKNSISNIPQKIPSGAIDEAKSAQWFPSSVIIDYFIKQKRAINYFTYFDGKKKETFHSDSLISKFKEFIDTFIIRNSKNQFNDENDNIKTGIFKPIYEKIEIARQKGLKNLKKDDLLKIRELINSLPDSDEKIYLLLKYGYFSIPLKTYFDEAFSICELAESIAERIPDLYERAISYSDIGNFAGDYQMDDRAISLYYLSRETFDNCNGNTNDIFYEQGLLCEGIARIFLNYYTAQSYLKSYNYSRISTDYFRNVHDTLKWNIANFKSALADAYMWTDLSIPSFYIGLEKEHEQRLNDLYFWYNRYNQGLHFDDETNLLGFNSIATNLKVDSSYNEALIYYLNAFPYASKCANKEYISSLLSNISYLYSMLGKEKLAMEFSELNLYFQEKIHDRLGQYYSLIDKANTFNIFKQNDSALFYLNKLQYDSSISNAFLPPIYENLLHAIFREKTEVFKSTNSDSANFYERIGLYYESQNLQTVSNLVEAESGAVGDYLERSRNKASKSSIELKSTLAKNAEIIAQIEVAKIETDKLSFKLSKEQSKADSLRRTDSLKTNQITEEQIKTHVQTKRTENERVLNKQQKKINEQQRKFLVTLIIASVLLFISVYFISRSKIQKKRRKAESIAKEEEIKRIEAEKNLIETDLGKKLAEQRLLNETALGHDLLTQMDHLPMFIEDITNSQQNSPEYVLKINSCLSYAEEINEYFKQNYALKGILQNKLSNEIQLAKHYCSILEKMKGITNRVTISTNRDFDLLSDIEIPKHNLVNFVANSFRHGGIGKRKINIEVNAYKENDNIILTIEDDGIGFESLNLENKEPNRGINLVLKQIVNYNSIEANKYIILFSPADIVNKTINGIRRGVIVTYKLLKK